MYHPLTRAHLYSVLRLTVTFDDCAAQKACRGTAFFLKAKDGSLYLVTNRHVVDAGYADARKNHWNRRAVKVEGFSGQDFAPFSITFDSPEFFWSDNTGEDVAALKITGLQGQGDLSGPVIPVTMDYLATSDDFASVSISDALAFPFMHGDDAIPVMRTGWVASDPVKDFTTEGLASNTRRIAIEGFSWSGYSGSPVFTLAWGIQSSNTIDFGGGFRPSKMIGINAGHIVFPDGRGHHSGISYLIKSTVLADLVSTPRS